MEFDRLAQKRSEVFKVELAAWLHDFGKFSPGFVKSRGGAAIWCGLSGEKNSQYVRNTALGIGLSGMTIDLGQPFNECASSLIRFNDYPLTAPLWYLVKLAHGEASGQDKRSLQKEVKESTQGKVNEGYDPTLFSQPKWKGPQAPLPKWWSLSPFGFSEAVYTDEDSIWTAQDAAATEAMLQLQAVELGRAPQFDRLKKLLTPGLADSQVPVCDVRLADMGLMTAAFAKAAVVEGLLTGNWREEAVQWRLLRLAVDGVAFLATPTRVPEVLARRRRLHDAFERVREAIEHGLLCGTEIYRDELGRAFVIPGFSEEEQRKEFDAWLSEGIETAWGATGNDVRYLLHCSEPFGLGAGKGYAHQLGALLAMDAPQPSPLPSAITAAWREIGHDHQTEPCSACVRRPVGTSTHERARRLCTDCYRDRERRVEQWLGDPSATVWLDEIADTRGRIALIAARFRVERWLRADDNGPSYLESTVFQEKPDEGKRRNIAPSAARLRRLFETLDDFWGLARKEWKLPECRPRIALTPDVNRRDWQRNNAYELEAESSGVRVATVWTGAEFVVAESLQRLKERLPGKGSSVAALWGESFLVRVPAGYRRDGAAAAAGECGRFTPKSADAWKEPYAPVIEILHDPRQFLALVPADRALGCVETLERLHQERFGRVRGRLGLDVTMVAANVDTPLRALLDAARRGLRRDSPRQVWKVTKASDSSGRLQLGFENGVEWTIPLNLGFESGNEDKSGNYTVENPDTPDNYFPYFETAGGALLHAHELQPGQQVKIEPSTFDYEFLDSSSRRFEVSYDAAGRRRAPGRGHRPLLLEEVTAVAEIWDFLHRRFGVRQLKNLDGLLDAKREEWGEVPGSFVDAVLRNMELILGQAPLSAQERERIAAAWNSGLLHDCLELHLHLQRPQSDRFEEDK
jgi:hypothetical protein